MMQETTHAGIEGVSQISILIPIAIYEKLEEISSNEGRSVNDLIESVIEKNLN